MKRREFIALLGGAAAAWPLAARAQQPKVPRVGWLNSGASSGREHLLTAFRLGMSETGFVDEQNVAIEYRWAEGQYERLPGLAADLARRGVAVIAATGGTVSSLTAKRATATIPVVGVFDGDPVTAGLVVSLNRPGGNITGISLVASVIEAKQLELLRELAPTATVFALLANPTNPNSETISRDLVTAARSIGLQLHVLHATAERELDSAFQSLAELRAGALMIATDPFFLDRRARLVALTASHGIPAIYGRREYTALGGLMSYGTSLADVYRRIGIYVGRILTGTKPADLPVMQPTKFEFVVNLKTAKALRLEIPPKLLAFADEVIE
jgi:putative tryptophan/tyrosine transport system substrate-binding protein